MAAFHSFPGKSQWLHERRVAHSCWAAPVLHRIPEHLTAVSAAVCSAAPMAVEKAFGKGGTPQPPLSGGLFFLPPLPEGIAFYPPAKGGFFSYPPAKGGRGGCFSSCEGRPLYPQKRGLFNTIPAYGETLSLRVRNARVCDDSLVLGCDDAQDTTHLLLREDVTGHKVAAGRSPGSRISLLTAPSRRHPPVVSAAFVPGHSGGSAPDSHRLPGLSLRKPTCDRSEKRCCSNNQRATYESGRYYTASYLSRVMVSRSMPSMRTRRVSPSRLGEWNSPTS